VTKNDPHQAFIIIGSSLATKTLLIKQVEELLGSKHHAGTFPDIKQHAPITQLDKTTDLVAKDSSIDTLISTGSGSPIDSAKAISFRQNERTGKFLHHIAISTTLSAAECVASRLRFGCYSQVRTLVYSYTRTFVYLS
jgi:alcohol dehydrogenase class IV